MRCPNAQEKDAMPRGKLAKLAPNGVIFVTYSLLVSGSKTSSQEAIEANNVSHDLQLVHYPHGSRLRQIVDWLKHGLEDVLIVFDESHKAKNLQVDKGKGQPFLTCRWGSSSAEHVQVSTAAQCVSVLSAAQPAECSRLLQCQTI